MFRRGELLHQPIRHRCKLLDGVDPVDVQEINVLGRKRGESAKRRAVHGISGPSFQAS